jgi:hypothetical protein
VPELTDVEILADGLAWPEGPVALADGSVLLVEVHGGGLTRVASDGAVSLAAPSAADPTAPRVGRTVRSTSPSRARPARPLPMAAARLRLDFQQ